MCHDNRRSRTMNAGKKMNARSFPLQLLALSVCLAGCAFPSSAPETGVAPPASYSKDPSETVWADIPRGSMRIVPSPDDSRLYFLHGGDPVGYLFILDAKSQKLLQQVPVGSGPIAMVVEGDRGYVVNYLSDDVTVVDLKTAAVVKTIPVGHRPIRAAGAMRTPYILVANYGSDSVSVIDRESLMAVKTLAVGSRPADMALDSSGRKVYLLSRGDGKLAVINLGSIETIQTVSVGEFPSGIALTNDGRSLFVSHADSNSVSVIDASGLRVVRSIPVGKRPVQVLSSVGTEGIYVLNRDSNTVSVIDPGHQDAVVTIPLNYGPRCMSASSDGRVLYVSYGEAFGEFTVVEMSGLHPSKLYNLPVVTAGQ
jgi:YVTN family beta-propeller protein